MDGDNQGRSDIDRDVQSHAGSVTSDKNQHRPNQEEEEEIARDETRCVLYLRFLTFAFLVVTTIGVAVTVQLLLRKAERVEWEEAFFDNADKVLEAVGTIMQNTLMAVDSFAVSLSSHANAIQEATGANRSWPFVTLPDMAVRASKLRSLSKIFLFSIYHYVAHKDRDAWEAYAKSNKGWIDQGIETQKADPTFRGNIIEDWNSSDEINFYGQRAADDEFYVVRWQVSPVLVCSWFDISCLYVVLLIDYIPDKMGCSQLECGARATHWASHETCLRKARGRHFRLLQH